MRLLFIHTHIRQNCGISSLIRMQARALRARGHDVHVAALETQMARDYLGDAAPFIGLPIDQYDKTVKNLLASLSGLIKYINQQQIDVVIASHRWAGFISYLATRVTRSSLISVDHNVLWGNKWLTFWGDGVVAVSKNSRQHLIDYFDLPAAKIQLIQNAIVPVEQASVEAQQRLLDELDLQRDEHSPLLLTIGRLDEQKGLSYLLDAMPQVRQKLPQARLLVVGTGELDAMLKAQAQSLGIGDQVIFTGLRSDVATFLSIADLFLMPSLWEGLPISMLEAMSVGLPVVATHVGGIPEVMAMSNSPAGIVVPPKESGPFGEAIVTLWQDEAYRSNAAMAARLVVAEHFSINKMVEQMETYLSQFAP